MTKIITKKTNAVFLAAVLVAGTFALISLSFIGGAQAYPDYGMDNNKYKSKYPSYGYDNDYKSKYPDKDKDKKVIVKKVKCNNINANLNGVEIGLPGIGTTAALTAQAAEDAEEVGAANAFGNDENGNDFSIEDNFVFVCINNNDNRVVGGEDGEETECGKDIEACFRVFLTQQQFGILERELESQAGITVEINGESVTLRSFSDICEALEGLTYDQLQIAVAKIVITALGEPIPIPTDLGDCIAEALNIPVPPR